MFYLLRNNADQNPMTSKIGNETYHLLKHNMILYSVADADQYFFSKGWGWGLTKQRNGVVILDKFLWVFIFKLEMCTDMNIKHMN